MTDIEHGVLFRWKANGPKYVVSWTDPAGGNGWLLLPDEHGHVRDATNLLSAITPRPNTDNPNGYVALAVGLRYHLAKNRSIRQRLPLRVAGAG